MIEVINTPRTQGRRLRTDDEPLMRRLYRDPEVGRTLGGVRSEEQIHQSMKRFLDHWRRHGFGLWLFHSRADQRFIGYSGLRKVRLDINGTDREGVELMYASRPEVWGQGLTTEIAATVIERAFGPLDLAELISFTLTTNRASQRVMEKNGFRYEQGFNHAGLPHVLYSLQRP